MDLFAVKSWTCALSSYKHACCFTAHGMSANVYLFDSSAALSLSLSLTDETSSPASAQKALHQSH